MSQQCNYDDVFFDSIDAGSLRSARAVVPVLTEMVDVKSVVDFGCGRGSWLKAFIEDGVTDVFGLDGVYVDQSKLLIDVSRFQNADFRRPIALPRRFDLAMCLEVGEHLPARAAKSLVRSITDAAPLVLFSAAVPGQGGTNHVNEQWPEYWRSIFSGRGFHQLDVVRRRIYGNEEVEWWYRQNLYLYAADAKLAQLREKPWWEQTAKPSDSEVVGSRVLGQLKSTRFMIYLTLKSLMGKVLPG